MTRAALDRAGQSHADGDLETAEEIYRDILEHFRFILTHSRQQPRSSCSARD